MSRKQIKLGLLVVFACWLVARPALAQPSEVILLRMEQNFPEQAWPEVEVRAEAELGALGFDVVAMPSTASDGDSRIQELASVAKGQAAIAAIRISRSAPSGDVTVWVNDMLTGKMSVRVVPAPADNSDEVALVALQVVELLHASLLEIRVRSEEPNNAVPPAVERMVDQHLETPHTAYAAWLGSALAMADFGIGGGPAVGLSYSFSPRFRLDADLFATLYRSAVDDSRGSASFGVVSVRLHAMLPLLRDAVLTPEVGIGGGPMVLWASGSASPGFISQDNVTTVLSLDLRAALALRISRALKLRLNASAGVLVPAITVRFAGEEVSSSRLGFDMSLAAEWSF